MRILICGMGSMGRRHALHAAAMGHRVCIFDTMSASVVREYEWVLTLAQAIRWRPEAVVIATPAATHSGVAQHLVAGGYAGPLFVEKPVAVSEADGSVFRSWAHATTQVGYNWRFHPLVSGLETRLKEGASVTQAVCYMMCDRSAWPGHDYGDALLEMSHEVDLALYFFGPATLQSANRKGTVWHLRLQHTNGCRSEIVLDDHSVTRARGVRLRGDGFTGGYDVPYPDPRTTTALEESYRIELAHFLNRAVAGAPTDCPFTDGLAVVALCAQAQRLALCPPCTRV